jgi:hypothetical protein
MGLKGYTPVALKELNTFLAVKLATQASQNSEKKSALVTGTKA